jgi:hypothetical protein
MNICTNKGVTVIDDGDMMMVYMMVQPLTESRTTRKGIKSYTTVRDTGSLAIRSRP